MRLTFFKIRATLIFYALTVLIFTSGCARKSFNPVWYGTSTATAYDLKESKDILASAQFSDADNGGGWAVEGVFSPKKHFAVGAGAQTLAAKGLIYVPDESVGSSRLWQANIMGGTYWNLARDVVSLQFYSGFSYARSNVYISQDKKAELNYQKLYIQPALMVRLPYSMYANVSWRLSQVYYTNGSVEIGVLPQQYIDEISKIDLASPFRVQELGIGYTYVAGPVHTGIEYTFASPVGNLDLPTFDYQAITTSLRLNISDMIKMAKKRKETEGDK